MLVMPPARRAGCGEDGDERMHSRCKSHLNAKMTENKSSAAARAKHYHRGLRMLGASYDFVAASRAFLVSKPHERRCACGLDARATPTRDWIRSCCERASSDAGTVAGGPPIGAT